jgi:hypothetical protein
VVRAVVEKYAKPLRVEIILIRHLHPNLRIADRQRDQKERSEGEKPDTRDNALGDMSPADFHTDLQCS